MGVGGPFRSTRCPKTLTALADHGAVGAMLPAAGDDGEEVLARFAGPPTLAHDSSTNALIRRYRMGKEAAR